MPTFSSNTVSNIGYSSAVMPSGTPLLNDYGYGFEISEDGNTIVAGDASYNGGNGAVYVFSRQGVGGPWVQTQTITWSLQSSSSGFGTSVSLSGDANTLVVGSLSNSTNSAYGRAQVYTRSASTRLYSESQTITVSTVYATAGRYVYISSNGSTIFFASPDETASRGAVYVYTKPSTSWTLQSTITQSTKPAFGTALSVSGDGNTIAVFREEDTVTVYFRAATTFALQGTLQPPTLGLTGNFGMGFSPISISYNGNTVAVGEYQTGNVYTFTRSVSTWTRINTYTSTVEGSGSFGDSVALSSDGSTLFIYDKFGSAILSGVTYYNPITVYSTSSTTLLYVYPAYYDGPEGFFDYIFSSFKCSVNGGTIVGSNGYDKLHMFDTGRYLDNNFYGHNGRNNVWTVSRFNELSAPAVVQDPNTTTTSFTFIVPIGAKAINVICIGGGGGGGGGARNSTATRGGGAGGGGGSVSEYLFSADALGGPGTNILVTIGAGGIGGAVTASPGASSTVTSLAGNNGTAGGTTTFGSFLKASGGPGGLGGLASGGSRSGSSQADSVGMLLGNTGGSSANNGSSTVAGAGGGGGGGGGSSASATQGSAPSTVNVVLSAAGTNGQNISGTNNTPGVGGGGVAESTITPLIAGGGSQQGGGGGGGGEGASLGDGAYIIAYTGGTLLATTDTAVISINIAGGTSLVKDGDYIDVIGLTYTDINNDVIVTPNGPLLVSNYTEVGGTVIRYKAPLGTIAVSGTPTVIFSRAGGAGGNGAVGTCHITVWYG
jgi:hypothetical protein